MPRQSETIPLGISGLVSVPRNRVSIRKGDATPRFLFTDDERLDWLVDRFERQVDSPIVGPGTGAIARQILRQFSSDLRLEFAKKLLLTVRDGEMHSFVAASGDDEPVAMCFVCWRGAPRDLIATRYGGYLNGFLNWIGRVNESGMQARAYLQIDAFIEEVVDEAHPMRSLDECVSLNVEYTYLPGYFFSRLPADGTVPKAVVMNLDLLSNEQKGQLAPLFGR